MKHLLLIIALVALVPGCHKSADKTEAKKPAKVEKVPVETEIGRITLTEQAERRLGVAFGEITEQNVQRRRTFGGDVLIPTGRTVIVSAPFAGTIVVPDQEDNESVLPVPGVKLKAGQKVLRLDPLLTPERDVPTPAEQVLMANARATLVAAVAIAEGDVQRGEAEVALAKVTLERSQQLLADKAGARRAVDDADGALNIAESILKAAKDRLSQLSKLVEELDKPAEARNASPLDITAPRAGVLRALSVSPGQAVSPGAALFEVVDTSTMWIRVPVFADLLSQIDAESNATVVPIGSSRVAKSNDETDSAPAHLTQFSAKPVAAPPSADALNSTVDIFFEIENNEAHLRPGQRVGMQLAMTGQTNGKTAPAKSILYDIYGGTWVYVQVDDHVFERRRVLISHMLGDRAVLAEGPDVGTKVVTDAAAELFGTEFGAGK